MHILLRKYGGTSLSTPDRREGVVERIRFALEASDRLVVVVSAMGRKGEPYATDTLLGMLREIGPNVALRELDLMMSCGEIISAAVMSHLLSSRGIPAVALTGAQAGIITEAAPGRARITRIDPSRIRHEFERHKVAVVAGFQGITAGANEWGDITTLGRGGSDTTAVALAVALGLPTCEIYTDVEGVFTCDPRIVSNARLVPRLSFEEGLELCRHGAKVVHARAVELAYTYGVKVFVGHFEGGATGRYARPGSWIQGEKMEISNRVTCISPEPGLCLVTVSDVPNVAGVAQAFVKPLLDNRIEFKLLQSGSVIEKALMSYEVKLEDMERTLKLLEAVAEEYPGVRVSSRDRIGRISAVGTGIGHPEYLWKVLATLRDIGANNYQIESFEHRISCYIDEKDLASAAAALHATFDLGA